MKKKLLNEIRIEAKKLLKMAHKNHCDPELINLIDRCIAFFTIWE